MCQLVSPHLQHPGGEGGAGLRLEGCWDSSENRTLLWVERLLCAAWRAGAAHMKGAGRLFRGAAISCVSQDVRPALLLAVNFISAVTGRWRWETAGRPWTSVVLRTRFTRLGIPAKVEKLLNSGRSGGRGRRASEVEEFPR